MARDPNAKLSPRVAEALASVDEGSPVEVIVEMRPGNVPASGPRKQRIEAAKADFERDLQGVAAKIAAAGGRVIETAWINQTVRSAIPAAGVRRVAEDDAVEAIDLPRPLEPDVAG